MVQRGTTTLYEFEKETKYKNAFNWKFKCLILQIFHHISISNINSRN